jgi:protein phosphatase 1 regulatory subunit 7
MAELQQVFSLLLCFVVNQELDMNHQKVGRLENLEPLTKVERLYFRWNLIKKIENLDSLVTLKELELYDNRITTLENLDSLVNLE